MKNDFSSDAVFNIVHCYRLAMRSELKANEIGLNSMHVKCLSFIKKNESCTAHDIVCFFDKDKSQIARLIKEMIEHKWITKTANPDDKRSLILSLTKDGEVLAMQLSEAQAKIKQQMLQGLSQEELRVFNKVSETMTNNLKLFK